MKNHSVILTIGLGILAVSVLAAPLQAASFNVNVEDLTPLYVDDNTGNEVLIGGFSGIFPVPGDPCRFYVVTDRGPSYDYIVTNIIPDPELPPVEVEYKVFLSPEFGPSILTVKLSQGGKAEIENIMPLVNGDGNLITGLSNTDPEELVDVDLGPLPSDADALDAEGLTMGPGGCFWVSEEYRPSVAMVAPNGTVLARLVPDGTLTGEELVPTFDILPGILAKRVDNRGLEGLAMAKNGILYAVMQRPLANPTKAASEASQNIRLIAIDIKAVQQGKSKKAIRQYIFRTELVHKGDYASDLFSVTPSIFLIPERKADKLVAINISGATDITPFENELGQLKCDPSMTIEMLDEAGLKALKIKPVKKTVVLDSMTDIDPSLEKCEGVCLVGKHIVLTADNDFNLFETVVDVADQVTPIPIYLQDPTNLPKIHVVPLPRGWAFGK